MMYQKRLLLAVAYLGGWRGGGPPRAAQFEVAEIRGKNKIMEKGGRQILGNFQNKISKADNLIATLNWPLIYAWIECR